MNNAATRCGYIAIVGRPNVGKSTLLNRLIGQKISITSRKPQTTRHRILGVKTEANVQAVYVDTPGMHQAAKRAINRYMNQAASAALDDVDLILFVIDSVRWTKEDEWALEKIKQANRPVVLIVNKVDKVSEKKALLPHIKTLSEKLPFLEIIPLSAKSGDNISALETAVMKLLPENPHFFPNDQITDKSERFLAAELIREKLIRSIGQEVPYALTVQIEEFKNKGKIVHISAIIWVERAGQKSIIIGKKGELLKTVGQLARSDMEQLFAKKVFLRLWCKIKAGWSDDERALGSLGYNE